MQKNVAGQKLIVFAFDATTNLPKSGDAANITAYVSKDYGAVTALGDTSATEMDATNAKGYYLFDLSQAETNADTLLFSAKSSTANVVVVGAPAVVFTTPANFSNRVISSAGVGDANLVQWLGVAVQDSAFTLAGGASGTITLPATDAAGNAIPDDGRYAYTAFLVESGGTSGQAGQLVYTTSPAGVARQYNIVSAYTPVALDNTCKLSILGKWVTNAVKLQGVDLTGRDIGANVLIAQGTGVGQINLSAGKCPALLQAADVTGNVAADLQTVKTQAVTCSAGVTVNPNVGTTQPINFTGTGGSALVKADALAVNGDATAAATFAGLSRLALTGTVTSGASTTGFTSSALAGIGSLVGRTIIFGPTGALAQTAAQVLTHNTGTGAVTYAATAAGLTTGDPFGVV